MAPGAACEARVATDEAGARLDVGRMSYRVVVVPPGTTLAENTVRLLREFAQAGGPVLALEPLPTLIGGRPSDDRVLPEATRLVALDGLLDALDELLPFDVRVPGRPAIWAHHRRINGVDCYFLANIDRDRGGVAQPAGGWNHAGRVGLSAGGFPPARHAPRPATGRGRMGS
jgi:hypothetical protein